MAPYLTLSLTMTLTLTVSGRVTNTSTLVHEGPSFRTGYADEKGAKATLNVAGIERPPFRRGGTAQLAAPVHEYQVPSSVV